MGTAYETDVIAWSVEQARLLRNGHFSALDIEHIADEVEDVGKSEQRELANRMAVLLSHLLKWQFQPQRQGKSWLLTIKLQRESLIDHLLEVPSLKPKLQDLVWIRAIWRDAVAKAADETGLANFPDACPWSVEQILSLDFLPVA